MISYKQEFLCDVQSECSALIEQHWEEIALNKSQIKLNPDWEAYQSLEDAGTLCIFTVRDDEALVGYFVVFKRRHIHYKDHLFASNDVLYLSRSHRRGTIAQGLLKFVEKCLKEDGVSVMVINTKIHAPFDPLLVRLGYTHTENLYMKNIGL